MNDIICHLSSQPTNFLLAMMCSMSFTAYADSPRIRLTETSITETGRITTYPKIKLETKGYGLAYVFASGVGFSVTSLTTRGTSNETQIELTHRYGDINLTHGDSFLITGGFGLGINGSGAITQAPGATQNLGNFMAKSFHVGLGFAMEQFEVYWIYRHNWADYESGDVSHKLNSQHYQLGLGWHF